MKQSLLTNWAAKQGYDFVVTLCPTAKKWLALFSMVLLLNALLPALSGWLGGAAGSVYGQCTTASPSVLVKWDFNSKNQVCNGAVPQGTGDITAPFLLQGKNTYCPNVNNGCGLALLGTKGFGNTNDFKSAICLAGFWRNDGGVYASAPGWTVNDPVFHPEIAANLNISYVLPAGKAGMLSSFSLKVLQKQFDGTHPSFEKQGVGVYRNGVLIYSQTQTITAADVNGATAMTFTFPNTPEFTTDGSAAVSFQIVFGMVHRLLKISTGYDDICLIGTCGGSPAPIAAITPATCGAGSANNDGKITLTNVGATDRYDISTSGSYTGSQTYATATTIPAGGVITSTLPNPATPQVYTVRVFTAAGCTTDLRVTLNPTSCSNAACTAPTGTVSFTAATCAGTSANNNARIAMTGVTGGDKVGISLGTSYAGPIYSAAQTLTAGAYSFAALPNPNGSQAYTVRVFNTTDDCFKDYLVTLNETSCGCKKIAVQVKKSDQADPDSSPNNNATAEDDLATYDVCKGTQTINLQLAKTVSPGTGTTCPVNTKFVWTAVLTNTGTMAATNIQVADQMSAGLVLTNATTTSGTYTISGGWLISNLPAGASATLSLTTTATNPGTYTNCVSVNEAFPLNNPTSLSLVRSCATITVTGAKTPTIVKSFGLESAKTGVAFPLKLLITNNESTPITLTAPFVDNLPGSPAQMVIAPTPNLTTTLAGVVATAGGTSLTIPAGTVLAPGLNQILVDVVAPADGEYCNTIAAGALQTTSCGNAAPTESCVIVKSTYVVAPLIRKSMSPAIVQTNQNATLTITIDNRNSTGITLLQDFQDLLPSGLVLAGAPTGTCPGLSVFSSTTMVGITAGSVIAAGTCTITIPVKSTVAGTYCNHISANALIGTVSNGSIPVMTGNEDGVDACVEVTATPCTAVATTSILPASFTVVPGGTLSLTATGTGLGTTTLYTWSGTGTFNPQSVTTTYTAPATAGTYTLTVVADNQLTGYGSCTASATISILVQGPVTCSIQATPTQSACNDNGTAALATDDYFTLTVNATATNGGASGRYEIVLNANADGTGGTVLNTGGTTYGTAATVGTATTFKADGATTYIVTVRDLTSPTCKATFTTTVVQSCSGCPPQLCIEMTGMKQ